MAEDAAFHEAETKMVSTSGASVAHCHGLSKHQHDDFLQIISEALHTAAAICAGPGQVPEPDMDEPASPSPNPRPADFRNSQPV